MRAIGLTTILLSFLTLCLNAQNSSFTDQRNGKTYKTVQIGGQTWMAENLDFDTAYSYCYKDNPSFCSRYGRLYEWEVAIKVCPAGWHLPSAEEWQQMAGEFGGLESAGTALHAYGRSGFKGLLAGRRHSHGAYYYKGSYGFFWSDTEVDEHKAKVFTLKAGFSGLAENDYDKYSAYSVRCVKNQ